MDHHYQIWKDTAFIGIGQLIGSVSIIGIFTWLGYFDQTVVAGSLAGAALATLNYFTMHLLANKAANLAASHNIARGQTLLRLSYMVRMVGLLVVLVLLARSGRCNAISLVLPLALNRPILTVYAFLHRKGGAKS